MNDREAGRQAESVADGRALVVGKDLEFHIDLRPVAHELVKHVDGGLEPGDPVPEQHEPSRVVDAHLRHVERGLDGAHALLDFDGGERLREGDENGHVRFDLGPLLGIVAGDEGNGLVDRHRKGIRDSFEREDGFREAGLSQAEALRGRVLVVGIEDDLNAIGAEDLLEQFTAAAGQIEIVQVRGAA